MIRLLICWMASLWSITICGQDNCKVFLWQGDSCRYEACQYLQNEPRYFQLTKEFHLVHDTAIAICPNYSDTYRAKSVAYLKTGDFINWKRLIDKAVELNPTEHLGYRAWCHFQFFRDYQSAIKDFEQLDKLIDYDLGQSQNGDYHLSIALALCYKMIGQKKKAIQIIETHLTQKDTYIGNYDYLHLGILYLEQGKLEQALAALKKQDTQSELAEGVYHQAIIQQQLGKKTMANILFEKAKKLYLSNHSMYDNYTHQVDKIYLIQIEEQLLNLRN